MRGPESFHVSDFVGLGGVKTPFRPFDPARRELRMNRAVARFRKLFRVKRLYDVHAGGACRWEHRSDYRRA
jgi:hypothetical protein